MTSMIWCLNVKNIATRAIAIVKMYLNLIFNNTHIKIPITAIILNHAALHEDKTIAIHSKAKLNAIIILIEVFMFGMNRKAAFMTM
jgi:hypothetical protein